jgi:hypothetical protein
LGQAGKSAPYAAEAVTSLADAERWQPDSAQSTASVYRDSEDARREQTLSYRPWAASGEAPQTIFIDDSVAVCTTS